MKKSKRMTAVLVIALIILTVVSVIAISALSSQKAREILSAIVSGDEYSEGNDMNDDGKVNVIDAILAIKQDNIDGPMLSGLTLDDSDYSVDFEQGQLSYVVNLPAGRPRIPKVSATAADGCTVKVEQATIADTETVGCARVTVSDNGGKTVYTVKFERAVVDDAVVLQYDDRWTFTPDYTLKNGESFTFKSENDAVISVDNNGVLVAEEVSNSPVKVKALVGDTEVDSLTVTKVGKAQVNLFLVTGQSNAQGCYDFVDTDKSGKVDDPEKFAQATEQMKDVLQPNKAGQVYIYDARPYWNSYNSTDDFVLQGGLSAFYDLYDVKRAGFASALGKTYYDLSGEKVVFLHAAYNGSCIERWIDPARYPDIAEDYFNHYENAQNTYAKLMQILDPAKYEINHRANFWLQGETCMSQVWDFTANSGNGNWRSPNQYEKLFSSEDYADMFMKLHNQMKEDFQIETNNILLVRAHGSVVTNDDSNVMAALNNVRSSQYGMANSNSEITIVSRFSDLTVRNNSKYVGTVYEPYINTMGVNNVHYNQTGHNINGIIAATNYFKNLDIEIQSAATSVEIIDTKGVKRFSANEVIGEIEVGKTKRIAAFPLPEYSLENITYTTSNNKVATINNYGLITIVGEGEAIITATSESGAAASVIVKGKARTTAPVAFRLNEDDTKSLASYLPEFRFADITYTSSNEDVATVSNLGVINCMGGGEATITATSNTGAYEVFVVTGIEKQKDTQSVHYRWDFDGDLTSSKDENTLFLSELATQNGAQNNYSFTADGMLFVDKNVAEINRPDFTMSYPVSVSSETDWSVEWRAKFTRHSMLIGRDNSNVVINGSNKYVSHIYSVYDQTTANKYFNNILYPIRFSDCDGGEIFLTYTSEYANLNKEMNTWKIDYKKQTGKMTLWFLSGSEWIAVDSVTATDFSATFNNILGRYNAAGMVNFEGWLDYIDIQVSPAKVLEDVHYRWEFESGKEYVSSADKNNLTPTATGKHTVANGVYKSTGRGDDLKMENAITLDTKHNWVIEFDFWTYENNNTILGKENCNQNGSYKNHVYFATSAYSGIRFEPDPGQAGFTVPFTNAAQVQTITKTKTPNKWRIAYSMATDTITVTTYDTTAGTWVDMGKLASVPDFTLTANCLFGDYNGSDMVNLNGTVNYFDIKIEDAREVTNYSYIWEFNNFASSGQKNDLTVPASTQYTLNNSCYIVTAAKQEELVLEKAVKLDSTQNWYIEWRGAFNKNSGSGMLFGTENSQGKYNLIYNAASTNFGAGKCGVIRIRDASGADKYIEYVPGATSTQSAIDLTSVWNNWRLEYDKDAKTLSLKLYNAETGVWNTLNSIVWDGCSFEFTTMFGDFDGANYVSYVGSMDYIKVVWTK